MDADKARILLTEYYDGNTSVGEERQLAEFFAAGDVPADMMADRVLFMRMHAEPDIPEGLEERLAAAIDRVAIGETAVARNIGIVRWLRWSGIAASVAVAFAAGYSAFGSRGGVAADPMDTCQSPEEAYVYAQAALVRVSECLNKGVEEAAVVGQTVRKIQTKMDRHITLN